MAMEKKGRFIFITGGSRSGKSQYAVALAKRLSEDVVFLATCIPGDEEMRERVLRHRAQRPSHWRTLEEGKALFSALSGLTGACSVVVVDCLTLFVSNLLLGGLGEEDIMAELEKLLGLLGHVHWTLILVSNEVGSGLVPETRLGRTFRDCVGRANQFLAQRADEAYLLVSGIPLPLKGGPAWKS